MANGVPSPPPPASPPAVMVQQQPTPHGGTLTTIAGGVFDAFRTAPVLLLIVLLNAAFAGVGGYYLLQVEAYRAKDREALGELLRTCLSQTVPIEYLSKERPKWSP